MCACVRALACARFVFCLSGGFLLLWSLVVFKTLSISVIRDASKVGLSLKGNRTTDGFWKFTSSAVFAATVVTTIGYGNMSPSSTTGQIFCVFFALFGIPLNMVLLNRVGKYMVVIERKTSDFLERKTGKRLHEGWTYSQAIYYCFITLSTIGFGDFVADSNPDHVYPQWYSVLMASWIFFGLAWLALIINHSIDILEKLNSLMKQWWGGDKQEARESRNRGTELKEQDQVKQPPLTQ